MNYAALISIVATAALLAPGRAVAQVKHYPLESLPKQRGSARFNSSQ